MFDPILMMINLYLFADINECARPEDNNCDFRCDNTEGGYNCSCEEGDTLDTDGHTCTGIFI